jgi:hypothetical protein
MPPLLLLTALLAAGPDTAGLQPPKKTRRADAVLAWNAVALECVRIDRTPPPRAARNLAILHAAVADAVNTIYQTHRPYRVRLRAVEPIDPDATVASASHRVLRVLYPRQAARLDHELNRALARVARGAAKDRGETLGRYVADRMLEDRRDDGSDRTRAYRAAGLVGVWQPTPPDYTPALLPHWVAVRPFALRSAREFRPGPPPRLTSREFIKDYNEVKEVGGRRSGRRTADETLVAWFWDDGAGTCTPPGHWNLIAREAALARGTTLPENARLFALLNITLADAGVACWDCKYYYRLWRPIVAVREAARMGSDAMQPDPTWSPLLKSPPFPSYTSGHSTFSGAAAAVLARFFGGDRLAFTCGSDGIPGAERHYKGFAEAAREAGRSRILGGIHYECDNREGLALGKAVADAVYARVLRAEDQTASLRPDKAEPSRTDNSPPFSRRERP